MKNVRYRVTRRQAESIVWDKIKPADVSHFDSIRWDTHSITFFFRHPEIEGLFNVSVYRKGDATVEVVGPVKEDDTPRIRA